MPIQIALVQHQHHRWADVGHLVEAVVAKNASQFIANEDGIIVVSLYELDDERLAVGQKALEVYDLETGDRVFVRAQTGEDFWR